MQAILQGGQEQTYKLQNALKIGATCLNLQLDAVGFQFSILSECAYKVEITSIDGTTFML